MSDDALDRGAAAVAQEMTAGQLLRQAREATGLHVAALAVAMKVPVKKLEALEADRFGELPDAVFVRALAGSMCRALKVDPAPILRKLPQSAALRFESDDRGINAPFHNHGLAVGNTLKGAASKPAVWLVTGLLLAALLVYFLPSRPVSETLGTPSPSLAPIEEPVPPSAASVPAPAEAAPESPSALESSSMPSTPVEASPAPTQADAAAPPEEAAPTVAVDDGIIRFKANAEVWIGVTDRRGVVRLQQTLLAGEVVSVDGRTPLAVVIGNVAATEVTVRGQPFLLDAFTKDNVARFEVK